jgi:hypothetical protein
VGGVSDDEKPWSVKLRAGYTHEGEPAVQIEIDDEVVLTLSPDGAIELGENLIDMAKRNQKERIRGDA